MFLFYGEECGRCFVFMFIWIGFWMIVFCGVCLGRFVILEICVVVVGGWVWVGVVVVVLVLGVGVVVGVELFVIVCCFFELEYEFIWGILKSNSW